MRMGTKREVSRSLRVGSGEGGRARSRLIWNERCMMGLCDVEPRTEWPRQPEWLAESQASDERTGLRAGATCPVGRHEMKSKMWELCWPSTEKQISSGLFLNISNLNAIHHIN